MPIKTYLFSLNITGSATAIVKANSLEEATKIAKEFKFEPGSEQLEDWTSDEVEDVEETND